MVITWAVMHVWQSEITARFLKYRVHVLNLNNKERNDINYCHGFGKVSVGVSGQELFWTLHLLSTKTLRKYYLKFCSINILTLIALFSLQIVPLLLHK